MVPPRDGAVRSSLLCTLRTLRTAAPAVLLVLVLGGAQVEASQCTVQEGEILVPQGRITATRIGPLTSLMADEEGPAQGTLFYLITFPEVATPDSHEFWLTADSIEVDLCDDLPGAADGFVGGTDADFDVTFYDDNDVKRGDSFDGCGDERGDVPLFASFAVVWLSAGSVPGSAFTFTMCPT